MAELVRRNRRAESTSCLTGNVRLVGSSSASEMSFLDATEFVLRQANRPLGPEEIIEAAIERGIVVSQGKTPGQTIKSKLSTDILRRGEESRFMRTDPNRFALRAWRGVHHEFIADRFQKALLEEDIVVFDRGLLRNFVPVNGLAGLSPEKGQELVANCYSMERNLAEEDRSVIQLVSQFLVFQGGKIASYKRTKRLPEARLHDVYSVLFGGHLNPEDVPPLFGIFDPDAGPMFIQRELSEELRMSIQPELKLVGIIYDPRTEVSEQHLGVFYEVHTKPGTDIQIGERGFLQQLSFDTPSQVWDRIADFENWSELVVRQHLLGLE